MSSTDRPSQDRMVISRRLMFSAAHLYRQKLFSEEENRRRFGLCYTEHGHGHNYLLEVFVEGSVDPKTKMVLNLTDLDRILKTATETLEHRHLNFDVPEFRDQIPTTENITLYLRERVLRELALYPDLTLNRLKLSETDDLWTEACEAPKPKPAFTLTREIEIRALHKLENASLSPAENEALYGPCYRQHGHHYKIRVTIGTAALDEETGLVFDRDRLDRILHQTLIKPLDGQDLNTIFPNTACEALARAFYLRLSPMFVDRLAGGQLVRVGVQETRKNYFEFPPE